MFSLYLVINVILLPLLNFNLNYNIVLLIPTIIMLISPLLNDIIYWYKKQKKIMLLYSLNAILLYGSMFFISILASFKSLFGKSVFLTTPKNYRKISLYRNIYLNKGEILFSWYLLMISYIASRSVLTVLLISIPSMASVYLSSLSNYNPKTWDFGID